MDEEKKGERVHGAAGKMQQGREQQYIEKHDQGKQTARYRPVSFIEQVVKGDIAAASESYDQNQNWQRRNCLKKNVGGDNKQGLAEQSGPA